MAPTNYQVATAEELLGAKTPRRRGSANVDQARKARIDEANRERSGRPTVNQMVPFREGGVAISQQEGNRDEVETETRGRQPAGGERSGEDVSGGDDESHINDVATSSQIPGKRLKRVGRKGVTRVEELKSQDELLPSSSSGVSRHGSNGSKRSRRDSQVTEIYFSPVDVNRSRISFTDPIDEPEAELTPTQERYDEERRQASQTPSTTAEFKPESDLPAKLKSMLEPEQVDRLVKALAECPLLQTRVSKQWWDDVSDATSVLSVSEATPSLTTASSSPSTLYSQSTKAISTEPRSPSITQESPGAKSTREYADLPKPRGAPQVASAEFGGIALVDPKVHGTPIRYVSQDYQLGTNTVKVGQCSFMHIPYGTTMHSQLRIEPPSNRSINSRVMLQVMNHVLERKTGQKAYLLVAELDVTASFSKAALTELAAHADMSLDEIERLAPGKKAMPRESLIDWCALADELQTECAIQDAVDNAAASFAHLNTESCTMQTLTLLSELERLKARHQDFLILRPTGHHDNGRLSGVHIPWMSQHLDQLLYDSDSLDNFRDATKAARLLRDRVAAVVAEGCIGGRAFDSRIWWGDQMRLLHCVPLLEGAEGRPAAWVAFLSDLGRYEGCLLQAFRLGYLR
ncbi:hypothetical protein LTR53_004870 [Teratosphaeriaceae sp. CCFEE 6253]|nr:hypothetical protein LTR53_004870 [Teratosphaeriaceae sp. CCFEE 6253]